MQSDEQNENYLKEKEYLQVSPTIENSIYIARTNMSRVLNFHHIFNRKVNEC